MLWCGGGERRQMALLASGEAALAPALKLKPGALGFMLASEGHERWTA